MKKEGYQENKMFLFSDIKLEILLVYISENIIIIH